MKIIQQEDTFFDPLLYMVVMCCCLCSVKRAVMSAILVYIVYCVPHIVFPH